jgi:tetrahydromethanopterin S-methyltransferase subunit H
MKTKLFVLALILIVVTNAYFKYTERKEIIKQNKELVQTIVTVEKIIKDYKEIVAEVENDPCLTEGAAAAIIDSTITGSDSYTEIGYQDPSMVVIDSVLAITLKVNK